MARFKKRYMAIVVVVAIVLIIFVSPSFLRRAETTDADLEGDIKGTPVEVAAVQRGDITSVEVITGKLEALHSVNVVTKVTGIVKEITAQVGKPITKGDTLFTIDDADIKSQLAQAKAGLKMAEASYAQNKERYENAKKDLARGELLYEQGAISEQALEQMRIAASDTGQAVLEAQLAQAKASYDLAYKQYEECHVTSPIDGTVAYINVGPGEMVSTGTPAAVVVDMSAVVLEGTLSENLINRINQGGSINVRISSAGDTPFIGRLKEISPAADQRTGLFGLKVFIENPEGIIKPGMFAEADLIKDSKEGVLYIPSTALLSKNGSQCVYIAEDGRASKREVITGIAIEDVIEILSGVAEGENVVIKGQDYLNDGETLRVLRGDSE